MPGKRLANKPPSLWDRVLNAVKAILGFFGVGLMGISTSLQGGITWQEAVRALIGAAIGGVVIWAARNKPLPGSSTT